MIHSKGGHWKELSVYQQVRGTIEQTPALWMTSCIFAFYSVNQTTLWSIAPSGKNALVIKWSKTLHFGNQNPSLSSTPCLLARLINSRPKSKKTSGGFPPKSGGLAGMKTCETDRSTCAYRFGQTRASKVLLKTTQRCDTSALGYRVYLNWNFLTSHIN